MDALNSPFRVYCAIICANILLASNELAKVCHEIR